jgi:hypothetical protein
MKTEKLVKPPEPRYDDVYFEGLKWLNAPEISIVDIIIAPIFETTDEYIARGGKITICPPAHPSTMNPNELKAMVLLRKLEKKNGNNNK